jgi:hypothetical protein
MKLMRSIEFWPPPGRTSDPLDELDEGQFVSSGPRRAKTGGLGSGTYGRSKRSWRNAKEHPPLFSLGAGFDFQLDQADLTLQARLKFQDWLTIKVAHVSDAWG